MLSGFTSGVLLGFLFGLIDRLGYQGWIGAEYKPATTTEAGLSWLATYGDKP